MDKNVLEWLERQAAKTPDAVCYEDGNTSLTFSEVQRKAQTIGTFLLRQNRISDTAGNTDVDRAVRETANAGAEIEIAVNNASNWNPYAPICVMSGRHVDTIAAFLGVVYSGRCYAPIDATIPDERIRTILETAKPAAILADKEHLKKIQSISSVCPIYCIEEILDECSLTKEEIGEKTGIEHVDITRIIRESMVETDPLYIIFTSGSTGVPKGVITSHHSLMTYIDAYEEVMHIDDSDNLGSQSPLDYIAAIRDIYLPLRTGCKTYLIPKENFMEPMALFKTMNDHHITAVGWSVSAFTVPVALGAFKDMTSSAKLIKETEDSDKPQFLTKICFSGSVMPGKVLRAWQSALPEARFVNQYGPTEATASCTYYPVDHLVTEDEVLPIGKPYRNYKIYLLNEEGTETAPGEEGEICVAGPILALGYYNNPEKTAVDFIQNPVNTSFRELIYKTGDYGMLRPDGNLEFHGRKDRQIKHMGHRVELDEVDRAALKIPGIRECCTVYNKEKEQIWLFYTGDATRRDISLALRETLPGFMIPRKIQLLPEIPHLPNGKIDMKILEVKATGTGNN